MQKVKYLLTVLCLVIFFTHAIFSLGSEGKKSYNTLKRFYGVSDDQKGAYLIGDLYRFAVKCNTIIPEDSNILFLSNLSNNRPSFDLLLNYYVYPRKLYWLNNINPYPDSPPDLNDLDRAFLSKKKIEWVICRYPEEYGVNKVVQLEGGKPLQSFTMDY